MRAVKLVLVALALAAVGTTCVGLNTPLTVPVLWGAELLVGWYRYVTSTLPRVSVRWGAVASLGVYLLVFLAGAHLFLRWLYREATGGRAWRARWTVCGTAVVLLLFSAGVAATGVAHQVAWLATSPEPLYVLNQPRHRVRCAANLRQIGMAALGYANAHGGRFPDDLRTLLVQGDVTAGAFVCPSDGKRPAPGATADEQVANFTHAHCSYTYVGRGLTDAAGGDVPVAYERPSNHEGLGFNVVYADCHVDWLSGEAAERFLRQVADPPRAAPPATSPIR